MDLAGLFERLVPDPAAFVTRVLEPVQDKLLPSEMLTGETSEMLNGENIAAPDELLAAALGAWLAKKFGDDERSSSASSFADFQDADALPPYDVLVERDRLFAGALGACHCWGERTDCADCQGFGAPGWSHPDKQLFVEYVNPAIRALRNSTDPLNSTEYLADDPI
jgi:hypothetical protein